MPADRITISLNDGSELSFDNVAEVSAWVGQERTNFNWLFNGAHNIGNEMAGVRDEYSRMFANLATSCNNALADPTEVANLNNLVGAIQSVYSRSRMVRSDHPFARIASSINTSDGDQAASAAFGLLLGIPSTVNFATLKGMLAAVFHRDGITPEAPKLVATTISDLNKQANDARAVQAKEYDALADQARTLIETTDSAYKTKTEDVEQRIENMLKEVGEAVQSAIKQIETTEAAYKEQMRLQAPVDYWETKAKAHKKEIEKSRLTLIGFTVLGSALLVGSLLWLANTAVNVAEAARGDTAIYLKYAAMAR